MVANTYLLTVACRNRRSELGSKDDLAGVEADCSEVAKVFKEARSLGVANTTHKHLTTKEATWDNVCNWLRDLPREARARLYFALHGCKGSLCLLDEDVPITDVIAAIERITPNSILMVDACECGLHEDGVMLPANYDDLKGASLVHPAPELQRFESSGTIRVRKSKRATVVQSPGGGSSKAGQAVKYLGTCSVITASKHYQYSLEEYFADESISRGVFTKVLCHFLRHYPRDNMDKHQELVSYSVAAYGNVNAITDDEGRPILPFLRIGSQKAFC